MGILDNIRSRFSGTKSEPVVQKDDPYEKRLLAENIIDLVDKVKKKNTFDSSIWNLSNANIYTLQGKSLQELKIIQNNLINRISELDRQSKIENTQRESLEASKWTGQKNSNMTNHDFDRFQDDDGR